MGIETIGEMKMTEYKKLLVLISVLDNLNGEKIDINIIKEQIQPLRTWAENRVTEIENEKEE